MRNVMVCVTQQRTCDRLIKFGHEMLTDQGGELFIIHVAGSHNNFLGKEKNGDALEYLYEKAVTYGANLTVLKSDDVVATLVDQVKKNNITHIVLGESKEATGRNNLIEKLRARTSGIADVIVIPA